MIQLSQFNRLIRELNKICLLPRGDIVGRQGIWCHPSQSQTSPIIPFFVWSLGGLTIGVISLCLAWRGGGDWNLLESHPRCSFHGGGDRLTCIGKFSMIFMYTLVFPHVFFLSSGNVGYTFSIDPELGTITLARALDLSVRSEYELVVMASDMGNPPLSSTCLVRVRVYME